MVRDPRAVLIADQDAILTRLQVRGQVVTIEMLCQLPPWRATMLAEIAARCNALPAAVAVVIRREATRVGGEGTIDPATVTARYEQFMKNGT